MEQYVLTDLDDDHWVATSLAELIIVTSSSTEIGASRSAA
jgi:hypothetical protein